MISKNLINILHITDTPGNPDHYVIRQGENLFFSNANTFIPGPSGIRKFNSEEVVVQMALTLRKDNEIK